MKNYKQFRDELQHAYPVSKWKIKLPIATKLIDFPDLKLNDDTHQIKKDLQDFLLMRFSENRILNVAKWGGIGYLKK
jgi:hypothetical protein